MEIFTPETVVDVVEGIQFRAMLSGPKGQEVLDCRLWVRDQSGRWNPDSNAVAIECHNLVALQRKRNETLEQSKCDFDRALSDIGTAFERAIDEARNHADLSREQARQAYEQSRQHAIKLSEQGHAEFNNISSLVLVTAENIIAQVANGS